MGLGAAWALLACGGLPASAFGQEDPPAIGDIAGPIVDLADRPVRSVVLRKPAEDGGYTQLEPTLETLARNQIRTRAGTALDPATLLADRSTLNRLGRFSRIAVEAIEREDGSVVVVFTLEPQPLIFAVQPVGNRALSDQEIADLADVLVLSPIDPVQVRNVARDIEEAYRQRGYTQAQVTADLDEVADTGVVFLRVREGDRLRVTGIRFEGNEVFGDSLLRSQIETATYTPILDQGRFDERQADEDVQSLIQFYRDRGYVDVRAGWQRIDAPNNREVIVVFHIAEGRRYTVRDVRVEYEDGRLSPDFQPRLGPEQVRGLIAIKPGDVYNASLIDQSIEQVYAALAKLGYANASVQAEELTDATESVVTLRLTIAQGPVTRTGLIEVVGNEITKNRVVLRFVELKPDTPFDGHELRTIDGSAKDRTLERLRRSRFFGPLGRPDVRVVLQERDSVDARYRDVLISVQEARTGSFNIGAAVSSDTGLTGQISTTETNFDITDWPESLDELLSRRAFRGGGQTLGLTLAPGTIQQEYAVRFREPFLLETNNSLEVESFFRTRDFDDFDWRRIGGVLGVGRRFGGRWEGTLSGRAESVRITEIPPDRPVDIFQSQGTTLLDTVGLTVTRTTFDNPVLPSTGSRIQLGVERAGLLGGDWEYTKLTGRGIVYFPIRQDFLGRATVANLSSRVSYSPDDPSAIPIFERFTTGGAAFRGFDVRGLGPVGVRNDTGELGDDQVGGTFELFLGAEIQQPIINENLRLVGFLDTGTILESAGVADYRVSVGFGLRLVVPQLTPVPLAFDFGFPLKKEDTDDTRLFTFTVEVPF